MLIKGRGGVRPALQEVGSPGGGPSPELRLLPRQGSQPLAGSIQAGAQELGKGAERGKREIDQDSRGGRKEKRKREGWSAGRRQTQRARQRLAFGAPPDSARGLFIEILSCCETVQQFRLGVQDQAKGKYNDSTPAFFFFFL